MNSDNFKVSRAYENVEFDNILKCVHCGLCLDACPTYRESGLEQDSPRGRLYIMNHIWRNNMEFSPQNVNFLDRCIDCRACETACPSNVPYGELIEKTRGVLKEKYRKQGLSEKIQNFAFRKVLPETGVLVGLSKLFKVHMFLGLDRLMTSSPLNKILPSFVVKGQAMLPEFSGKSFKTRYGGIYEPIVGNNGKRADLFTGCVADVSDADVQHAVLRLLRHAGFSVHVRKNQHCCGALQVHGGDRKSGLEQAVKNVEAFSQDAPDQIVTAAGGCLAQLREYHLLFPKEDKRKKQVADFESRLTDILQLLGEEENFVEENRWDESPDTVLYDAPCHLIHASKVDKTPRALLAKLPGVTFAPLTESDACCGSGGIYNLLQPKLADKVLDRKINSIRETMKKHPKARTLVSGNPGCLFQIRYGVKKSGLPLRVIHPAVYISERLKSNL